MISQDIKYGISNMLANPKTPNYYLASVGIAHSFTVHVGQGTPHFNDDSTYFATKMTGYDHQGSYSNKLVKDVTTYSVARIAIGA